MLFTSVPVNALSLSGNETSSEENNSSTDSDAVQDNPVATNSDALTEDESISDISSNDMDFSEEKLNNNISLQSDNTEDEEELSTDNWELGLVFYDSTVDNGKTPLTSIDWDASDGGYQDGTPRVITVQINYRNTNATTTYNPGELEIEIPNLVYNTYGYQKSNWKDLAQWNTQIVLSANYGTNTGYDWNYSTGPSPTTEQSTYKFTNANRIDNISNFEGNIQIAYTITPLGENYYQNPFDSYVDLEKGAEECTHNYKKSLNAELKYNSEMVCKSNQLDFDYTRTYIHPWQKVTTTLKKEAFPLDSLDALGDIEENPDDYIWVKYRIRPFESWADEFAYPRMYPKDTMFIKDEFPEECLVYKDRVKQTPVEGNIYELRGYNYYDSRTYERGIDFYVGYPKSVYNEENDNLVITNYAEKWGKYPLESEPEKLADASVSLNLNDFGFTYTGNLYSINKGYTIGTGRHYYPNFHTGDSKIGNGNKPPWAMNFTVRNAFRSEGIDVKFGDDVLCAPDKNNQYRILADDEYYFNKAGLSRLSDGSGGELTGKHDIELWIRRAGNENYELYKSFKTPQYGTTYTFTEEDAVVGYYFLIKNVKTDLKIYPNYSGHATSTTIKGIEDLYTNGKLYNFCYLEAYHNGELHNTVGLDSYATQETKNVISTHDIEKYGHYVQRGVAYTNYYAYSNPALQYEMEPYKSMELEENDAINQEFKGSANIGTRLYSDDDVHASTYLEYSEDVLKQSDGITGFEMMDLLPAGMELTSIPTLNTITSTIDTFYDKNKNEYTLDDVKQLFEEHTTIEVINNWNNTNRTHIHIKTDLSDDPLYLLLQTDNAWGDQIYVSYKYKFKITYNSYFEYGKTYKNNIYINWLGNRYGYDSFHDRVSDNGAGDPQEKDINSNGNTSETLNRTSASIAISTAVASHQSVTKYVQTDKTNYTTGIGKATPGTEYTYKLNVNTGANKVTNLVIYDSIEEYAQDKEGNMVHAYGDKGHWNGKFKGIDTSYAESKGYVVKPYYSEDKNPGNLFNEDGSLNPKWKNYYEESEVDCNGLSIKFNNQFKTESASYDYLEIYYNKDGKTYKLGKWGGTDLAGQTVNIPTNDFYLYWKTDGSSCNYYGFSIDSITPNIVDIVGTENALPSVTPEDVTSYPDSAFDSYTHGNYGNNVSKMWHYTYDKEMKATIVHGPDVEKVKSIAFKYEDQEGNAAILPENSMTYVLVKMEAPSEEIDDFAFNGCYTQWNALDNQDNPIDFITGINSNIVRVSLKDTKQIIVKKIWKDENNKYDTRPNTIDIILKKDGNEIERKQMSKENNFEQIVFDNISIADFDRYSIEEVPIFSYNDTILYEKETDTYIITNEIKQDIFTDIKGTKSWKNDVVNNRPQSVTLNLKRDGELYKTTTTNANNNWEYIFSKLPLYNKDGQKYNYTVEEESIYGYQARYNKNITQRHYNGVEIKFNKNCSAAINNHYMEIYYKGNDNKIYKMGRYSPTSLANSTVSIPGDNFYIYWHTDSSTYSRYGFSIDYVKWTNTTNKGTQSSLPGYTPIELTGEEYPETTHNPYQYSANIVWHYTKTIEENNEKEITIDIENDYILKNIEGEKIWEGDTEESRPENITINLLRNGEVYKTTTTNAEKEWKYMFSGVPSTDEDGIEYTYSIEEVPVDKYTTQYTGGKSGMAITFNSQFKTESVSYDYVEIYYKQDGQTYKLGRWGGTALAGKTVNVPTNDFYLYWRTDSSNCSYYGFSIDSIESIDVNEIGTVATLPNYTVTELTGSNYPESPNHGNYGNKINMLWHYTGNFTSDVPAEGLFNIVNTYEGADTIKLSFIKEIEGTDEAWSYMKLDKASTYKFQVSMKNIETNDVISIPIDNKNTVTVNEVPVGTYVITEKDDMYFDFVSMEALNAVEGVTFEKVGNDYVLTITDAASDEETLQIKVNNKIEPDRPYEDKKERVNLFDWTSDENSEEASLLSRIANFFKN